LRIRTTSERSRSGVERVEHSLQTRVRDREHGPMQQFQLGSIGHYDRLTRQIAEGFRG
jgi:hypothetical protein